MLTPVLGCMLTLGELLGILVGEKLGAQLGALLGCGDGRSVGE